MILITIDNGDSYECHEKRPAVFCPDWDTARAAEKEWNTWYQSVRAFWQETRPTRDMDFDTQVACHDKRRVWCKHNPPPFWFDKDLDRGYVGESLTDFFIDLVEIPVYEPKAAK